MLRRTIAQVDVTAPDGRGYVVRVVRVLWPRDSRALDSASDLPGGETVGAVAGAVSLFTSRTVWSVRSFRATNRLRIRPLIYGEELRDRDVSVRRALEIAQRLVAGHKP